MSKTITRLGPRLAAIAVAAAGSVLLAPAAHAAQGEQALTCDGHDVIVRTGDNNSSEHGGWSAAQIVEGGSGTLVPTSFSGGVYDVTLGQEIFSFTQVSGAGHAHGNQDTVTCNQVTTATLGDLLEPGDEMPDGASLDDQVTFTIAVTAIHQP